MSRDDRVHRAIYHRGIGLPPDSLIMTPALCTYYSKRFESVSIMQRTESAGCCGLEGDCRLQYLVESDSGRVEVVKMNDALKVVEREVV